MKDLKINWFNILIFCIIYSLLLFALYIALVASKALAAPHVERPHVQRISVKYDEYSVLRETALLAAMEAAKIHRKQTKSRMRVTRVSKFIDEKPWLAEFETKDARFDYLYFKFARPINYKTTLVMASPMLINGKEASAGASFVCDRHGGVSLMFGGHQHGIEQRALVASHELGHIMGAYHTPTWIENIMHPDAQKIYHDAYRGFYLDTYSFGHESDVYFKMCKQDSARVKYTGIESKPVWEMYGN